MTSPKAMKPIYSQSQDEDLRSNLKNFVSTDVHNYIEGAAKKKPKRIRRYALKILLLPKA